MTKTADVPQCGPWCPHDTLHPGLEGMMGPADQAFWSSHFQNGFMRTVEPACTKMRRQCSKLFSFNFSAKLVQLKGSFFFSFFKLVLSFLL